MSTDKIELPPELAQAVAAVMAAGHGRVTLVVEGGHPKTVEQVITHLSVGNVFKRLSDGLEVVREAGEGAVGVVVRNKKMVHVEVVTKRGVAWHPDV